MLSETRLYYEIWNPFGHAHEGIPTKSYHGYEHAIINLYCDLSVEIIGFIIHGPYGIPLPIAVLYPPPWQSEAHEKNLLKSLSLYARKHRVLIIKDFNTGLINWDKFAVGAGSQIPRESRISFPK